jgi:hypothetical protein
MSHCQRNRRAYEVGPLMIKRAKVDLAVKSLQVQRIVTVVVRKERA